MRADHNNKHLFDDPQRVRRLLRFFYGICTLLLAGDIVLHRHAVHPLEAIPMFYPVFGFVACVTLVLVARRLRTLLKRPENYYGAGDEDAADEPG